MERGSRHIANGLVVPYRVSQWLPRGFPPPRIRRKRWLLYANVNGKKHATRAQLAGMLYNESARLQMRRSVFISTELAGVEFAANFTMVNHNAPSRLETPPPARHTAQHSVFCLCPTGDSKGFTARLYFSLVHGCIPVRVDGHRRSTQGPNQWRYPFPRLLDWDRLVVDVPWAETPTLLRRLKAFTAAEITRRQDYLHSVAH
eukprot:2157453-Prymnesium_polylepis.2